MHIEYAQLPPAEDSADRIFITDSAIIVLDGASAFAPVPVSPQAYVDHLGPALVELLRSRPGVDLRVALEHAIRHTALTLQLQSGNSPSATVAILRERPKSYDMLVLGDTPIFWGTEHTCSLFTDRRLQDVAHVQRMLYKSRLQTGLGFDKGHADLLRDLQSEQIRYRNVLNGYWIAESDPNAAHHAITNIVPFEHASWCLIATDGAIGALPYLTPIEMQNVCNRTASRPARFIECIMEWEHSRDGRGTIFPRAKISDDKALAFVNSEAGDWILNAALMQLYERLKVGSE